jgi:hypothetical protein
MEARIRFEFTIRQSIFSYFCDCDENDNRFIYENLLILSLTVVIVCGLLSGSESVKVFYR